jgi:pimeloyl-ACP methyl ester carboxylesterase
LKNSVYIFSGLGTDERVFQKLKFENVNVTFIQWIPPKSKETLEEYVVRISKQITSESTILVGLSFGGMVAVEVSKIIKTKKLILLATAKGKKEIPIYFRFLGKIGFHKLIPSNVFRSANLFTYWFFGIDSNFERKLLKQILVDMNPTFLKWAIDKIVNWENIIIPQNAIHIHGSKDRILPLKFIQYDVKIQGGGHFMTINKYLELNEIIKSELELIQ